MLEPLQDVGFGQEIKPRPLLFAHFLHCPAGVKALMLGKVDGGHTAFADDRFDFVSIIERCKHNLTNYILSSSE